MYIKRANKSDIPAINALFQLTNKFYLVPQIINNRDLSYCVREENGELIGFIWCGVMAGNQIGYIDYLSVNPECNKRHIAADMIKHVLLECRRRKVKRVIGLTIKDQYHDRVLVSVLKCGLKATALDATSVIWNLEQ